MHSVHCMEVVFHHIIIQYTQYPSEGAGGGAGIRGCEAAYYLHEASACEGRELGGLKPP